MTKRYYKQIKRNKTKKLNIKLLNIFLFQGGQYRIMQGNIKSSVKHLRRRFRQKRSTAVSCWLFSQKALSQTSKKAVKTPPQYRDHNILKQLMDWSLLSLRLPRKNLSRKVTSSYVFQDIMHSSTFSKIFREKFIYETYLIISVNNERAEPWSAKCMSRKTFTLRRLYFYGAIYTKDST